MVFVPCSIRTLTYPEFGGGSTSGEMRWTEERMGLSCQKQSCNFPHRNPWYVHGLYVTAPLHFRIGVSLPLTVGVLTDDLGCPQPCVPPLSHHSLCSASEDHTTLHVTSNESFASKGNDSYVVSAQLWFLVGSFLKICISHEMYNHILICHLHAGKPQVTYDRVLLTQRPPCPPSGWQRLSIPLAPRSCLRQSALSPLHTPTCALHLEETPAIVTVILGCADWELAELSHAGTVHSIRGHGERTGMGPSWLTRKQQVCGGGVQTGSGGTV